MLAALAFTAQEVIAALVLGLAVGIFMGIVVWDVLVAYPLRRERETFRGRLEFWQIAAYTASTRATAKAYARLGRPELAANGDHSKAAERPALRSVPS